MSTTTAPSPAAVRAADAVIRASGRPEWIDSEAGQPKPAAVDFLAGVIDRETGTSALLSALRQTMQMLQLYQIEIDRRVAGGATKHSPKFDALNTNANEALEDARAAIDSATRQAFAPESVRKGVEK